MDVESYRQQLLQVDAALKVTPGDEELLRLKLDLEEIIKVSLELETEAKPSATDGGKAAAEPAKAAHGFSVGDKVAAPYAADGLMYPAVVIAVAADGEKITVEFDGYKNIEDVAAASVLSQQQLQQQQRQQPDVSSQNAASKRLREDAATVSQAPAVDNKSAEEALRLADREMRQQMTAKNKRLKQIKHREEKQAKALKKQEERKKDVDDWKKFNAKQKRGHTSFKGLKKKQSIFASPTTVEGRVGVIGSDKKMTANQEGRKKHIFQQQQEE